MFFTPENEMGLIVRFVQLTDGDESIRLLKIGSSYPDAEIQIKGKVCRVEFEYKAKSFIYHGHDPKDCDLIVCWINDLPEWFKFSVWEISTETYTKVDLDDKELEILKLRLENKRLKDRLGERDAESLLSDPKGDRATDIIDLLDTVFDSKGRIAGVSEIAQVLAFRDLDGEGNEESVQKLKDRYKGYVSQVRRAWMRERNIEEQK